MLPESCCRSASFLPAFFSAYFFLSRIIRGSEWIARIFRSFFFFFLFPSSAHSSAKGTIEILSFDNESSSNYFPSIRKINERKKRNKTLTRFFRAFVSKGAGVNGRTKSEASGWRAVEWQKEDSPLSLGPSLGPVNFSSRVLSSRESLLSSGESICFSTTGRSIFFLVPKSSVSRHFEEESWKKIRPISINFSNDNYHPSRNTFIPNLYKYRNVFPSRKRVFVSYETFQVSSYDIPRNESTKVVVVIVATVVIVVVMVVVVVIRYRCEKKHYFYARITRTAKKRKGTVYQPRFSH